ncbi:hypothetical protein [Flavobacterium chungbukense]|uniref:Lipoprotein n=1 Tax=Flavobacterium chungbukense TaxID=877464 RepID=A0ABP7Y695_9FLAO|nr:hypothetical protein [Flavobacterium chungbukense]MCC4922678.1 hypothetical protein [Flavobacterium chungbukense]
MKNVAVLILGVLICSCSSSQLEKQIINDFLDKEFLTDKHVSVLVEEAIPKIKALEYYEKAYSERNLYFGEIRFAPLGPPPYKWEIDSVEINLLKKKYKNDTLVYYWKTSDFKNPKFQIYPYQILRRPDCPKVGSNGIYLSKPLISLDEKYAFLFYRPFAVGFGGGDERAVLLKKINGKWEEQNSYTNSKSIN